MSNNDLCERKSDATDRSPSPIHTGGDSPHGGIRLRAMGRAPDDFILLYARSAAALLSRRSI
jgi:hypothetical protein